MTFENKDTGKYYNNKYWRQYNFYSIDETSNDDWFNHSGNKQKDNVYWSYQSNSNTPEYNNDSLDLSNTNNVINNFDWSYQSNSNVVDDNDVDWSYQSNSNVVDDVDRYYQSNLYNISNPVYDINTWYGENYNYQQNNIENELTNIYANNNIPKYSQKKQNKTKIFKKLRKENLLYKNYMENYEFEIEEIRSTLSDKNTIIKDLEEKLITMEKKNNDLVSQNAKLITMEQKNNDLVSQNDKLIKKKDVYLNIINKWENWYDHLMEN